MTAVETPADVGRFLAAASPLLLADEARHNLILGIASTIRAAPALYPEARFWLACEAGEPVAAALRTPPHHLVLARPRDAAALDRLVAAIDDELPGVVGAVPEVDAFVHAWTERTGARETLRRRQGVYALDRVLAARRAPGRARRATQRDLELVLEWWRAFGSEALGETRPDERRLRRAVDHRLDAEPDDAGIVLWEDEGRPVSLAGYGGTTPNGIRIGPVYTPPELRGRGYASALVAALSSEQLARGRRFCFLYTDLANPVANRIYERIGYRRVCESAEVALAPGTSATPQA